MAVMMLAKITAAKRAASNAASGSRGPNTSCSDLSTELLPRRYYHLHREQRRLLKDSLHLRPPVRQPHVCLSPFTTHPLHPYRRNVSSTQPSTCLRARSVHLLLLVHVGCVFLCTPALTLLRAAM